MSLDLQLAVLDHVVQERRRQHLVVEAVLGETLGDGDRVVDVGAAAARVSHLAGVGLARHLQRGADQLRALGGGVDADGAVDICAPA